MRALVAAEILIAVVACAYGSFVLPRHSLAACVAYVAFCAIMAVAAAVLWYVFVVRRLVWWGRSATPARLAKVLAASFAAAVLVELGTLVGAPLSSPFALGDWHASRIAAFFAMALPVMCCVVMYDWRALALRMRGSLLVNDARLAKRVFAHTAASVAAGALAALTFGILSEWTGVGNPGACRVFAGVVAALAVVLFGLRHSMAARPERGFLAVALAAGFLFAFLTPWYTHVSWDDHIHYDRAVAASYLVDPEYTSADAALVGKAFHDVAYFSRYHGDPNWVNAYDEERLKDRYGQLDELGKPGKLDESGEPGKLDDPGKPGKQGEQDGSGKRDDHARPGGAEKDGVLKTQAGGEDSHGLLPLGARPDIPGLEDLGPGARLFDGSEPQAVRLDGAVTLRGVSIVEYYTVAYIPAAVGLWVARLFSLPSSVAFLMGRLFSLAYFALVAFFACKRLKSGKMLLCVCALVPTMMYLAANYSYDAWLAGFLMLGFAIFAGELQRPCEPLRWRWFLLMVAAFLVGLGPKAVYVPVAAMLLFMPRFKFAKSAHGSGGKDAASQGKQAGGEDSSNVATPFAPALTHGRYLVIVFASAAFVLATFVLPLLFAGPGTGDARGGDVNPAVQIAFITGSPLAYLTVFFKFCAYFFSIGNVPFILTDFCGVETSDYAYGVMALLLAAALTDRNACDTAYATHSKRAAMFALLLLTFFLICTALFISFTPAGWDWITGVQGRYLLPLLVPFGLFCLNFRPFCRLGERIKATRASCATYHYGVLLLGGYFALASIAQTIVLNA